MAFIGFLAVVLILFLLFRLYIYNLESEERKKKYEKKPIKINEESFIILMKRIIVQKIMKNIRIVCKRYGDMIRIMLNQQKVIVKKQYIQNNIKLHYHYEKETSHNQRN